MKVIEKFAILLYILFNLLILGVVIMNRQKLKRIIAIIGIVMLMNFAFPLTTYALDSRITASGKSVDTAPIFDRYGNVSAYIAKANGYITAKEYHSCTVKLHRNNIRVGEVLEISSKKWGYKKVSNSTGWSSSSDAIIVPDAYSASVYYDFDYVSIK